MSNASFCGEDDADGVKKGFGRDSVEKKDAEDDEGGDAEQKDPTPVPVRKVFREPGDGAAGCRRSRRGRRGQCWRLLAFCRRRLGRSVGLIFPFYCR